MACHGPAYQRPPALGKPFLYNDRVAGPGSVIELQSRKHEPLRVGVGRKTSFWGCHFPSQAPTPTSADVSSDQLRPSEPGFLALGR